MWFTLVPRSWCFKNTLVISLHVLQRIVSVQYVRPHIALPMLMTLQICMLEEALALIAHQD